MKKQEYKVFDSLSLSHAIYAVCAIQHDKAHPVMVEIKPYIAKRLESQKRLLRLWDADCSRTSVNQWAGNDKDWWHTWFKELYLVDLYCMWFDDYAELWQTIEQIPDADIREKVGAHVTKETRTERMNITQHAEYINLIEKWCHDEGIYLRTDSLIWREAMGYK